MKGTDAKSWKTNKKTALLKMAAIKKEKLLKRSSLLRCGQENVEEKGVE